MTITKELFDLAIINNHKIEFDNKKNGKKMTRLRRKTLVDMLEH